MTAVPEFEKPGYEEDQLSFMEFEENEVVAEIKALDLDAMSPMEALTKLYALKAKAKNM